MRKQTVRAWMALVAAMMMFGASLEAQTQSSGWPGQVEDARSGKPPVVKTAASAPRRAAAAVKTASAPKTSAAPKAAATSKPAVSTVVVEPVEPAAPVPAVEEPPAKAVVTPAVTDAAVEVANLLQQQSDLLKKLAAEMDSQRTVISEQAEKIKSLEAAQVTEAPAPAVAPAAAPAPPPPPAITVETGGVKLKVSGLFQGWYTASSGATVNTFRLRRAELKFTGDISPRIKWTVMVDPAKALSLSTTTSAMEGRSVVTGATLNQGGAIMQDAFVAFNWKPGLAIEVGQQRVPLGMEGTVASGRLDVVERALFMSDKARGGGYAFLRDFGVIVRGAAAGGQIEYSGGVFNGLGEAFNDIDANEGKSMAGRIVARPTFIKGLQVGASMSRDRFVLFDETARERQGVEVAYARGIFGFRTEYMGGRDAAITRQGGYLQATARVHRTFTLIGRFDTWDPDTRSEATPATVTERDWLGGFTYVLHPSGVWLQGNYIRKTFDGLAPSRHVFMTNVQTAW